VSDQQEAVVDISHEADVATARITARSLASQAGLTATDVEAFATAVSEIARNIIDHATFGRVELGRLGDGRSGVYAVASDHGPGIPDVARALTDGYSTSGGLGAGLGGAKRLVDDLVIESTSTGAVVRIQKLRR
jgi:serine/threonine-protein kinase RsbT